MTYRKLAGEITLLLGVAVVLALAVNFFSPAGIALFGQWDTSTGVISAHAKSNGGFELDEIDTVKEAKKIHDKGGTLFVDARSKENYEDGHIPGAVSFPVGQFDELIGSFLDQHAPDRPIVTYCSGRTCEDSHHLAQLLSELGFDNVRIFIDGFPGWEAEGYPIE